MGSEVHQVCSPEKMERRMKINAQISSLAPPDCGARASRPPGGQDGRAPRLALALLLLAGLFASPALAQQKPPPDEVGELKKKVIAQDALIKELLEWKKKVETAAPPAARDGEVEPGPEVRPRFPDTQFHGFGDVTYHASDRKREKNAFAIGQLDLFLTSRLSENVSVLAETVIESEESNEFVVEIERLALQYSFNEYFNVAMGRYHTAIGYYNTAYHHGQWFQTAVGRPTAFAFEDDGGILPIHNVGLSVNGSIPSGKLGLHYIAEVGNGRDYNPGHAPVLNISDNDNNKAVNLALFMRPDALPGFQAGVSVYHDRLTLDGKPRVDQFIFAGHAIYKTPAFEWLNEAVLMRHDPSGRGAASYTSSFYTQIGRQFGAFRPYFRYQYLHAPSADPVLQPLGVMGLQHGPAVGVRYDFTDYAALKVQFNHTFHQKQDAVNELTVQAAFTF